jgi:hypothetical protein
MLKPCPQHGAIKRFGNFKGWAVVGVFRSFGVWSLRGLRDPLLLFCFQPWGEQLPLLVLPPWWVVSPQAPKQLGQTDHELKPLKLWVKNKPFLFISAYFRYFVRIVESWLIWLISLFSFWRQKVMFPCLFLYFYSVLKVANGLDSLSMAYILVALVQSWSLLEIIWGPIQTYRIRNILTKSQGDW